MGSDAAFSLRMQSALANQAGLVLLGTMGTEATCQHSRGLSGSRKGEDVCVGLGRGRLVLLTFACAVMSLFYPSMEEDSHSTTPRYLSMQSRGLYLTLSHLSPHHCRLLQAACIASWTTQKEKRKTKRTTRQSRSCGSCLQSKTLVSLEEIRDGHKHTDHSPGSGAVV